jgi:hypothetical protein
MLLDVIKEKFQTIIDIVLMVNSVPVPHDELEQGQLI